jgi:hypothetical protein
VPLTYLGKDPVVIPEGAHVVVSAVRNEILRLPYLVAYYRALGFDRFLFADNNSNDGTREFLLMQPDCFVFGTEDSYLKAWVGLAWINELLYRFGDLHWCLVADADEMLVWPGSENETIGSLTARLDALNASLVAAPLLDMYSDKPFGEIGYRQGMPFLEACPYFDRGPYRTVASPHFPYREIVGGVRARALRSVGAAFHPPLLTKVPLVKWRKGYWFTASTHRLTPELKLAPLRGALLHFKMFDDLPEKCRIEVERREHFAGAREYRALGQAIRKRGGRSFFSEEHSVRYAGTEQLVALGIMSTERAFEDV